MYQGPKAENEQANDDYLLGKMYVPQNEEKSDIHKLQDNKKVGALWLNKVNSKNDTFSRINEDPLMIMKRTEIEARERILSNPVKMAKIKHELDKKLNEDEIRKKEKKEAKKAKKALKKEMKKEKKEKKFRERDNNNTSSSDSDNDSNNDKYKEKERDDRHNRRSSRSRSRSRDSNNNDKYRRRDDYHNYDKYKERDDHHNNNRRSRSRSRSRNNNDDKYRRRDDYHNSNKYKQRDDYHNKRSRSRSRSRSKDRYYDKRSDRNYPNSSNNIDFKKDNDNKKNRSRSRDRSRSREKKGYGLVSGKVNNNSDKSYLGPQRELIEKKLEQEKRERDAKLNRVRENVNTLTEEEKQKRLMAMQNDADKIDVMRWQRLSQPNDEINNDVDNNNSGNAKFLKEMKSNVLSESTIESRVKQNKYFQQKGNDYDDDNNGFHK